MKNILSFLPLMLSGALSDAQNLQNLQAEQENELKKIKEDAGYLKLAKAQKSHLFGWYEQAVEILKTKMDLKQGFEPTFVFTTLLRHIENTQNLDPKELNEILSIIRAASKSLLTKKICEEMLTSITKEFYPVSPGVSLTYLTVIQESEKQFYSLNELRKLVSSAYLKTLQRAVSDYTWSLRESKEKRQSCFKNLLDTLQAYFLVDPEGCAKETEELVTQFSREEHRGTTYIAKTREDFLALLVHLKRFSPTVFEKQVTIIKNDKKKMGDLMEIILSEKEAAEQFKGTQISADNMISYFLNRYKSEENADDYAFKNRLPLLLRSYKKELFAALPEIIIKNPSVILNVYREFTGQYSSINLKDIWKDPSFKKAFLDVLVQYCQNFKLKGDVYFKLRFLNILILNDKNHEKMKHKCYQAYFKNAKDIDASLQIIHALFETKKGPDELLGYNLLSQLLNVSDEAFQAKENPLNNLPAINNAQYRHVVIHYLFKCAQASYDVQLNTLHRSFYSTFENMHGMHSLAFEKLIKSIVLSEDKKAVKTNPIYTEVMASLTKPVGILPWQIETAVKWWGDKLRSRAANETNSAAFDSGYLQTNANAEFSTMMMKASGATKSTIQRFEASLKKKIEEAIVSRPWYLELKTDYHAEGLLREAAEEALLDSFDALPWKTSMIIEGESVLKKGTITVNGVAVELATTKQLVIQQYQNAIHAQFGVTASAATVESIITQATPAQNTSAAVPAQTAASSEDPRNNYASVSEWTDQELAEWVAKVDAEYGQYSDKIIAAGLDGSKALDSKAFAEIITNEQHRKNILEKLNEYNAKFSKKQKVSNSPNK